MAILWHVPIVGILLAVESSAAVQRAGYYCLSDSDATDLLHIDFILNQADDHLNHVYGFDQSQNTELRNCSAQYDVTNNVFYLRVSVNTTSNQQTSPSEDCGIQFVSRPKSNYGYKQQDSTKNVYSLHMAALALEGLQTASDKFYTLQCESKTSTRTTGTISVGSIDHVILPGNVLQTSIGLVNSLDLTPIYVAYIGDSVKIKFIMTFSSSRENLDIIGARITSVFVSDSDIFINYRAMIDENGCPVPHSEKALSVTGPFETASNGSSPFVAYSPTFEMAIFTTFGGKLHFKAVAKFCYTTDCFQVSCNARKRRATDDSGTNQVTIKGQIKVLNPYEGIQSDQSSSCYSKGTFAAVTVVLLVVIAVEIFVLILAYQKLSILKSKVAPSPRKLSFENEPLYDNSHKNPLTKPKSILDKPGFGNIVF